MNATPQEELASFPANILRDLARNESADPRWRKAAVLLMLEKGYKEVNHPDLAAILMDVRAEHEAKTEVESIVESAIESEIPEAHVEPTKIKTKPEPEPSNPALKASFTTANF